MLCGGKVSIVKLDRRGFLVVSSDIPATAALQIGYGLAPVGALAEFEVEALLTEEILPKKITCPVDPAAHRSIYG
jgi:hypothetical protein